MGAIHQKNETEHSRDLRSNYYARVKPLIEGSIDSKALAHYQEADLPMLRIASGLADKTKAREIAKRIKQLDPMAPYKG